MRRAAALGFAGIIGVSGPLLGQVKTNVPDAVPGARPAVIERIKVHGAALEGNLEGDAVDRDVVQAPRRAHGLWHHARLRDLSWDAHKQCRREVSRVRGAVFRQNAVVRSAAALTFREDP